MKKAITYAELLERLKKLPPKRLQDTATVFVATEDEYFAVMTTEISSEKQDVLDPGHLVMVV
jgi:hypothetical protein